MINRFYFTIKVLKDKVVDKWTKQIVNWLKTSLAIPLTKNEGFFLIFAKHLHVHVPHIITTWKENDRCMLLERGSNHTFGLKKKSSISYAIRGDLTLIGFFFWSGLRYPAWQELRNCSKVHTYICRRLIKKNRYTCIIYGASFKKKKSFNASQLYPCITSSAGEACHW